MRYPLVFSFHSPKSRSRKKARPILAVYKVDGSHSKELQANAHKTKVSLVCISEKQHKYKTNCQRVCNVGQEEYSLESVTQLFY